VNSPKSCTRHLTDILNHTKLDIMKAAPLFTFVTHVAFAIFVHASPTGNNHLDDKVDNNAPRHRCLRHEEVVQLKDQWVAIFSGIQDQAKAKALFADNFVLYSQTQWYITPGNPYYGPNATGPVRSTPTFLPLIPFSEGHC
jgi:hypothetical protein